MTTPVWLSLGACAGQLALALLASTRISKSPLALPLALACIVLFGWNFAALGHDLSHDPRWRYADVSISPFTLPVSLHFVLAFTGDRHRMRVVLGAAYIAFGLLSLLSASAFVLPWGRDFAGSDAWAVAHLLLLVPGVAVAVWALRRHLVGTLLPQEQTRTYLVISALVIGATFASTELLGDVGLAVPRLGNVATLTSTCLLAIVAFRFGLFEHNVSRAAGVYALAGASVAVLAYLLVARAFAANAAMLVVGLTTLTIVLLAATRRVVTALNVQRARRERLTAMGRLSSQMAHDLKNPLAALKGAIQFLQEERRQGRSIDGQMEFLDLLANDVERLGRVIEKYRRLGSVQPVKEPIDLNLLVRTVLDRQRFVAPHVRVEANLGERLPEVAADPILVETAFENLVQNSLEAMATGGTLTVRTECDEPAPGGLVSITVSDTGRGMSARERERVFEEFYTTKKTGSGLGLPFVRRVAEAHGGDVSLRSTETRGTTVRLRIAL